MAKSSTGKKVAATDRKRKKRALGRGLDALIPTSAPFDVADGPADAKTYLQCDIDLIQPNRYQPRRRFVPEELTQLSDSIRAQGVLQPLLVRRMDVGYELVAGERRLRAAKLAGLDRVPVVVKDVTDTEMLEMSIVENIQRENLNPMEEAEAYHRLISEFDLTQEQAAERVGKSRSAVANFLRLRQLPEPIQTSIVEGRLSMGHARALLGADTAGQQTTAWRAIIGKGLSVRDTEALIKKLKRASDAPPSAKDTSTTLDHQLARLSETLARRLGTKVQIRRKGRKGRVEIEFYSDEDLNRLLDLLGSVE